MYFALHYWRYGPGKLPESSHESLRGRLAGLTPVHDELPPAPQVSQEAEPSKLIWQDVAQPILLLLAAHRRVFRDVRVWCQWRALPWRLEYSSVARFKYNECPGGTPSCLVTLMVLESGRVAYCTWPGLAWPASV